jgi:glyceraldehyde 3-phosphate dehydrogenase
MAVKVGINGFGRIGRNVFRTAINNPEIEFVAVNDLTSPATLAHLLKYDSILGNLPNEISAGTDYIQVDDKKIKVYAERDPAKLPWAEVGAQIVVEATLPMPPRQRLTSARPSRRSSSPLLPPMRTSRSCWV